MASLLSKSVAALVDAVILTSKTPRYAPFVYDAWKNSEVLSIISKIAGVELVTAMDFEIAHVNISFKSEKQKAEELEAFIDRSLTEADEGIAGCKCSFWD